MILTDKELYFANGTVSGQNFPAESGRRSGSPGGENRFTDILEASRCASGEGSGAESGAADGVGTASAQEEFSKNQGWAGRLIEDASGEGKKLSREELMQALAERRDEILKKLKNGDTGVKIPIGSLNLTQEKWDKLIKSFDKAQEKIQESIRKENGEGLPEKRPDTTVNGDKVLEAENTGHEAKSLEEVMEDAGIEGKVEEENFPAKYFPGMKVTTKTGNCDVSPEIWGRTDFPFWEYFKKGISADALNNWQPQGPQPGMLDPKIQRNLQGIGYGKISILIPEKLQAKMDADPAFAEEIYRKAAKWKEDYDARDNAAAAALGMNVAAHQFSKSYCISLDEEGNVGNFTVVSGGLDITESEDGVEDNWIKRRNAAILFHKQNLAGMGYTGITGTAGILSEEEDASLLALLRAALMGITELPEEDRRKKE